MAHIMDVRVGLIPTGWECPRCQHVYGPLTAECFRCAPPPVLVLTGAEACGVCRVTAAVYHGLEDGQPLCVFCAAGRRTIEPRPAPPAETCCSCGSTEVTYHNYREQPFCRPCANGEQSRGLRPAGVDDPLTLRLPPYMAAENGSQRNAVGRTWTEVFPGLQCRLHRAIWTCSPDGEPTGADIEFRLVPEDERGHD